ASGTPPSGSYRPLIRGTSSRRLPAAPVATVGHGESRHEALRIAVGLGLIQSDGVGTAPPRGHWDCRQQAAANDRRCAAPAVVFAAAPPRVSFQTIWSKDRAIAS